MGPGQSQRRPRRRWQFSLATLFILMTVVCLILSRFYPRIYASAEVQIPVMTAQTVPTYMQVVRTKHILSRVADRRLKLANTADVATLSWLQSNLEVRHVEKDVLEIRMSGRPGERDRLQEIVDAIAAEYVDVLNEMFYETSDEAIALIQKSYDELKASPLPEVNTDLPIGDPRRVYAERDRARQIELLQAVAERLEQVKEMEKNRPAPPKVIRSRSGLDW